MYQAEETRYERMEYRRCGNSGIRLPRLALGLWHNFGEVNPQDNCRRMVRQAFDLGINHFDLANNYGPPPGAAETMFGRIFRADLTPYRDELIISSKAGYLMWPGPYGEWGSRKSLLASLEQSLRRLGLDYVDIFYSHRYDPETPLEETMGALAQAVRQGKALYAGLSNYPPAAFRRAVMLLRELNTPCLIHQCRYSMLAREPERELLGDGERLGVGFIAFCPLAQGLLTSRYLNGIPADSRAARPIPFLQPDNVAATIDRVRRLNALAERRGQTLAQMALAWTMRRPGLTSVLIGASRPEQIVENVGCLTGPNFTAAELAAIEAILPSE
ncbi:MAG: aldo/keto reductase [Victivallales bacterium]|nr:aldo/keto reductase [Victivallales bacterium]